MYKTTWDDKDAQPDDVKSFVANLEEEFVNTDGQLQVKFTDSESIIEFEVFNLSVDEAQEVFESFERELQVAFGYESYTMQTSESKAKATIQR